MRIAISRLAALALIAGAGCLAAQAASQSPAEPAQQFTVLRTGRFVGGAESLTSATATCSITGTGNSATMECQRAGTAKDSYHFNTALLVDARGAAYVIACRVPLVLVLCKKLDSNSVMEARMDGGLLAITDGDKVRRYQILATANIGPLPSSQTPPPKSPAQVRSEPAPVAAPATPPNRPGSRTQSQPAQPPGDSSAACASSTGACVTFVSEPSGAEIYVDGKFVGDTPSMIILAAGSHGLRIQGEKYAPWTRAFEASTGNKVTIRAALASELPPK